MKSVISIITAAAALATIAFVAPAHAEDTRPLRGLESSPYLPTPPEASEACGCAEGTTGECINPNNKVCYEKTHGQCPAGTQSCFGEELCTNGTDGPCVQFVGNDTRLCYNRLHLNQNICFDQCPPGTVFYPPLDTQCRGYSNVPEDSCLRCVGPSLGWPCINQQTKVCYPYDDDQTKACPSDTVACIPYENDS